MRAPLTRRSFLRRAAILAAALGIPTRRLASRRTDPDAERLDAWTGRLRSDGLTGPEVPFGRAVARVGELALGTPYLAGTLDAYLGAGAHPLDAEPLTVSLTHFDCVTLVESCLAVARSANREGVSSWEEFGSEIARMRYRGGERRGYGSRLHYFSEWISDGASRGLVRELGAELGGVPDERPLRFMTTHRGSYPALANEKLFREIGDMERRLDGQPRPVVATARIAAVTSQIETGDVLGFATAIPGLDVTHAALAYRDQGDTVRVLHAPLSGGLVQVSRTTLAEYVAALPRATGILIARPLRD